MTAHSPISGEVKGSTPADELDTVFDTLSHHRRRNALACLSDASGTVALADLAEDVAAREKRSNTELSGGDAQAVYTTLRHVHLPKLDEAGAVEHDPDRKLVSATATTGWIEHALSVTPDSKEDL